MNAFTIKDLENLSGIKAHTIRIWEQRYNFLKPQRTATNIRYYSNEELKTILNVALLNKYGYKISHISRMQAHEIIQRILSLDDAAAVKERIINDLVKDMVDLDMEKFEQTLASYISSKGIERTVLQIIFPFLEKIGILWQTGHINPAQEHLVTNIIRQKLIVAIEAASPVTQSEKTILLFLPEGEYHELGLLFVYYILKNRGFQTIYLGANVPFKDVEFVVNLKKPDLIYIHLTIGATNFNFEKFINNLSSKFSITPVIISGQLTQHYKRIPPPTIRFARSLTDITNYLTEII